VPTIASNYLVKIGVYNEAGELVKEILIDQFPQPVESIRLEKGNLISSLHGENSEVEIYYGQSPIGTWDGTNNNGDLVSNGSYYIKVDNIDTYGAVKSTTQGVVVSRAIASVEVNIFNEAGEVVRHLYGYMDDPGLPSGLSIELSSPVIQPGYETSGSTPNQVAVILSNGVTIMWEGKSDTGIFVQNGQYFIEVHTLDGQGREATVTKQLSVRDENKSSGVGKVTARPNILNSDNGFRTVLKNDSAMSLALKNTVYTTAGELVGVMQGEAGTNQVVWDASGVASGLYLAVVEGIDSEGGLVSRQIVKIVVIH
jgi:flagellar hook assembly protein FlgD